MNTNYVTDDLETLTTRPINKREFRAAALISCVHAKLPGFMEFRQSVLDQFKDYLKDADVTTEWNGVHNIAGFGFAVGYALGQMRFEPEHQKVQDGDTE